MLLLYTLSVVKICLLLTAFFTGELVICFTVIFATSLLEFLVCMILSEHSRLNTVKPAEETEDNEVTTVAPVISPTPRQKEQVRAAAPVFSPNPRQKEQAFMSPTPH